MIRIVQRRIGTQATPVDTGGVARANQHQNSSSEPSHPEQRPPRSGLVFLPSNPQALQEP